MTKTELDPPRVILGVVAANRDSDLLLDVALAAGLRFDAALSDRGSNSYKNRFRELLPRILAAPLMRGVGVPDYRRSALKTGCLLNEPLRH